MLSRVDKEVSLELLISFFSNLKIIDWRVELSFSDFNSLSSKIEFCYDKLSTSLPNFLIRSL